MILNTATNIFCVKAHLTNIGAYCDMAGVRGCSIVDRRRPEVIDARAIPTECHIILLDLCRPLNPWNRKRPHSYNKVHYSFKLPIAQTNVLLHLKWRRENSPYIDFFFCFMFKKKNHTVERDILE